MKHGFEFIDNGSGEVNFSQGDQMFYINLQLNVLKMAQTVVILY